MVSNVSESQASFDFFIVTSWQLLASLETIWSFYKEGFHLFLLKKNQKTLFNRGYVKNLHLVLSIDSERPPTSCQGVNSVDYGFLLKKKKQLTVNEMAQSVKVLAAKIDAPNSQGRKELKSQSCTLTVKQVPL